MNNIETHVMLKSLQAIEIFIDNSFLYVGVFCININLSKSNFVIVQWWNYLCMKTLDNT